MARPKKGPTPKPDDPVKPPVKSNRGGKRKGAGRKPKAFHQKRQDVLEAVETRNVEFLARAFENLIKLANGGYERVEEEWTPEPIADGDGFLPTLVLTKRKVTVAEPCRASNIYLIDRQLGRPKRAIELTGPDGSSLVESFVANLLEAYGKPPGS